MIGELIVMIFVGGANKFLQVFAVYTPSVFTVPESIKNSLARTVLYLR